MFITFIMYIIMAALGLGSIAGIISHGVDLVALLVPTSLAIFGVFFTLHHSSTNNYIWSWSKPLPYMLLSLSSIGTYGVVSWLGA